MLPRAIHRRTANIGPQSWRGGGRAGYIVPHAPSESGYGGDRM